ncbi:proprotein convertase subtilisin/kexin type 5-like [Mizuhopecten yessoensis]|uniref:Proprotein convertase subtilisin/kexin type 5 n=1 Tax=Mizuhopecten yessoensis TaxID=6573 RepID=A0A210PIV4_MIZYE|nr:proprotein convertase subtilisin/kexin type 5-like [Mizuhopecten yessoensis]XP_021340596.1 proprotein convertase subtilisin/kexin type 5-like [Mizuhopecten yessoensis]OWF36427.1 Proprotein convertase subtilisin/kexin type 5 [Mizuhopecten yessoensis]
MVREDFSCVYHCFNATSMVYNKSCVTECPRDSPFNESGICVSKCSTYNILYGSVCIRDCPVNMFRYNKTCTTSCPKLAPFDFEALNTKFCLESCPDFTLVHRHVCKLQCPDGFFLWNRTCVRTCPDSAPIIYVLNKRVPQFKIPICITNCPDDTFSDGISCVKTCDKNMYVFNSTCVDRCPTSHRLLEGSTSPYSCVSQCRIAENLNDNRCTAECPDDKLVFDRTCVSECPISNPLVLNQECLSQCPIYLLNESGTCVSRCSKGHYMFNRYCVKRCPETHRYMAYGKCNTNCSIYNLLIWNNSCFSSCPKQAMYTFNQTCLTVCPLSHPFDKSGRTSRYSYQVIHYCVASCSDNISPAIFIYGGKCKCSAHLLSHNFTCVENCPSPYNLVHNGECLTQCPNHFVGYNNTCQASCPEHAKYVYDGLCREACPSSHPYYAAALSYPNSLTCLESCTDSNKSPGRFLYNMTCVKRCPNATVLYGSNCIQKCPLDNSLIYKKEDNGNYIIVCVDKCPVTTFTRGKNCYDQCPEPLASYLPNRTCLEQCPKHRRFRYRFRTNVNTFTYRCKSSCDKIIFDSTSCVDVCPPDTPFEFGQTCVRKCPATHMFHEQQKYRCLAECKPPLVEVNHTCFRSCPASIPFLMNNTCVEKCPKPFNMTSPSFQGPTCVRKCLHPLLRENNKCTQACTGKFIVNNVCEDIIGCPNEYRYIEKSSRGTICRKVCQENEFVFEDVQCTKKCPKFDVENQCVESCPDTHPYTVKLIYSFKRDSTCYSTCPKLTYDNSCVNSCPPSYLVFKSKKTCVKECPASDPIKSNGECLKTCPGSKIASEKNTCIDKFECDSSKGLHVYDSKCVTQCPSGTYRNYQDNTCSPMSLGYILLITVLAVIGITCLFGAYLVFRRNSFYRQKLISNNVEQAETDDGCLTLEIDATDDAVGHECDASALEMYNNSPGYRQNTPTIQTMDDSSRYNDDTQPRGAVDDSSRYKQNTQPDGTLDDSSRSKQDKPPMEIVDVSPRYKHDTP